MLPGCTVLMMLTLSYFDCRASGLGVVIPPELEGVLQANCDS